MIHDGNHLKRTANILIGGNCMYKKRLGLGQRESYRVGAGIKYVQHTREYIRSKTISRSVKIGILVGPPP
jgi:hypothetical protein